jgi:hypothetical protein
MHATLIIQAGEQRVRNCFVAQFFEHIADRDARPDVVVKGDIETMYPAYAMLSLDAAYASVTALRRHYRQDHNRRLLTVEVVPPFKPMERLATLDMACDAVLGACIGDGDSHPPDARWWAVWADPLSARVMCPVPPLDMLPSHSLGLPL